MGKFHGLTHPFQKLQPTSTLQWNIIIIYFFSFLTTKQWIFLLALITKRSCWARNNQIDSQQDPQRTDALHLHFSDEQANRVIVPFGNFPSLQCDLNGNGGGGGGGKRVRRKMYENADGGGKTGLSVNECGAVMDQIGIGLTLGELQHAASGRHLGWGQEF